MVALAERLRRELDEARVTYREQALKFVTSVGVASISSDPAERDRGPDAARDAAAAGPAASRRRRRPRPGIPDDLERVLRYLENLDAARLGDAAEMFAKRLKRISKAIQAKKH